MAKTSDENRSIRHLLAVAPWLPNHIIAEVTERSPQRISQVRKAMGLSRADAYQLKQARELVKKQPSTPSPIELPANPNGYMMGGVIYFGEESET